MLDENNGQGHEAEYEALLLELQERGVVADGDKMSHDGGTPLLSFPAQRHSNASLLVSIPNLDQYYDKDNREQAHLLDLIGRCIIKDYKQGIWFTEWLEWIDEFTQDYTAAFRYLQMLIAVGGVSRQQYVEALTSYKLRASYGQRNDKNKPKGQYQEGKLS